MSNPLNLEIEMFVRCYMDARNLTRSSQRAASALNYLAVFLAPWFLLFVLRQGLI